MPDKSMGNAMLDSVQDEELRGIVETMFEKHPHLDRNNAEHCQMAIDLASGKLLGSNEAKTLEKILKKEKVNKRYHVELANDMGKDFSDIAEKMGLTLNAVVRLMLMESWQKYKANGFEYIYLGVADKPIPDITYPQ